MSGVIIVRYLLAHNAPLLNAMGTVGGVQAADRISAGDLPLNAPMPGIPITQITSVPRNTLSMKDPRVQHTDRVQVSALVHDQNASPQGLGWPGVTALLKLVLAACPNTKGTINGVDCDSILPAEEGPDLYDDATKLCSRSRDFIVRWNSPT